MKKALITGITGQDGSYLADLLLEKGYEVHGIIRRASTFNTARIDHLYQDPHINGVRLFLHYGDLSDSVNLVKLLYDLKPDEVYHLAAQSHVRVSFDIPEYTSDVTGVGTIRILEAMRETGIRPRFYQASSSEMFGKVQAVPQTETTPFWPRSPYGVAKVFAYWATVNYRESYNLFASNGILFNHESPRRGETFVTRKITRAVAAIKNGPPERAVSWQSRCEPRLGLRARIRRRNVANASADEGDDFVLATNETHTVREFVEEAFAHVDLDWKEYVKHDDRYERPAEVELLIGDPAKAKKVLGWEPKVRFKELVQIMVDADLQALSRPSSSGAPRQVAVNPNARPGRASHPLRRPAVAQLRAATRSSARWRLSPSHPSRHGCRAG